MESIDERIIDNEFLLEYFPSPSRFHETSLQTLEKSREIYLKFKNKLNQERVRIGKERFSDSDIIQVLKMQREYKR